MQPPRASCPGAAGSIARGAHRLRTRLPGSPWLCPSPGHTAGSGDVSSHGRHITSWVAETLPRAPRPSPARPQALLSPGGRASEDGSPGEETVLPVPTGAGLHPQHTTEGSRGRRHPFSQHPTCRAPEPLQPCEERLQGAVGCRGRVPAPAEPPPSLPCPWPLVNRHCPEIGWEVSVNQRRSPKPSAKRLCRSFREELALYKIKQHES